MEEERICEMRIGRPVRVARSRRETRWRWPVKLRGCWRASSTAIVVGISGKVVVFVVCLSRVNVSFEAGTFSLIDKERLD